MIRIGTLGHCGILEGEAIRVYHKSIQSDLSYLLLYQLLVAYPFDLPLPDQLFTPNKTTESDNLTFLVIIP